VGRLRSGFSATGSGAKWVLSPAGSLPYGDGTATTSPDGLTVVPTGTNPATGEPAFVYTTGQEQDGGAGQADHLKWYAMARHTSSAGYTGFDTVPGQVLTCGTRMAVRTYGTAQQPFGGHVTDPHSDLRLASAGLSVMDPETNIVFDFFFTDTTLYAFYERLPRAGAGYAAFSYALPVASRTPDQREDLAISFDKSAGTVTWRVDGRTVMSVDRIGYRPTDRSHLLLDLGGTEEPVLPRQLSCGMGMFTLLDAAGPDGMGLVRLTDQPDRYVDPRLGPPTGERFADDRSLPAGRLWGQGVRLSADRMVVSSLPGQD
jgi:hypothetical protein